jgi:site-specific recombinase XerD
MDITILREQFCQHCLLIKKHSPETVKRYRRVIRLFADQSSISTFDEINEELMYSFFLNGRTQRNWKSSTYITYHNTLSVFFKWCIKRGIATQDFTLNIDVPKKEKTLPKKLSQKEALSLIEVAYNLPYPYRFLRYRNHAIFSTFIFTGLRKSELLSLKFTDVDLENLTIFVRKGKGAKDRILPINYTLAQSLTRYLVERQRLKRTCPEFFTSLNRNKGFTSSGLKRLVEKVKSASGINFSVHKLRHTFATLMLEGGCDIFSLSKMMGHSDIKTTTIYLSTTAEHLRSQMSKHPFSNIKM